MEKTKDIAPDRDPFELPEEAKAKIRSINQDYDAKIAEMEINVTKKIREMAQSMGQQELQAHAQEISRQVRAEKDRINAERRDKTEAIREQYLKKK